LAEGADEHRPGPIRDNLARLYGVTSALEVTLKMVEAREWGFVLRALMREGSSAEKVVLALSFTKDGDGWLRPLHCSGTLRGLRKKLKEAGLFSSKSG
jgi:hypothetical protein